MGVFVLIGIVIVLIGLARQSIPISIIGLLVMGVGIAGDQNGY